MRAVLRILSVLLLTLLFQACSTTALFTEGDASEWVASNPYLGGNQSLSTDISGNNQLNDNKDSLPADRQKIIQAAKKYLGTPYKYGGADPSGFDCSGFTGYVYKKFGVDLNRSAKAQFSQGEPVSKPKPGDLVFFNTSGSDVSHVGIYTGNLKMIHAPRTGKNVEITSLNIKYWKSRYRGARSVIN